MLYVIFFFQAEDGIRDYKVTGVQTCALPISGAYRGWGTIRMYGFGAFQPPGYACLASASETAGTMMTSCPGRQFTGVATLCFAVSWQESRRRRTSSKLRPVLIG